MDFLMLLPHSIRVVIEVDGKHHHAAQNGLANAAAYAAMLTADRDLRLAGYDVYRFGAHALSEAVGHDAAVEFFERLFRLHKVPFPAMQPSKHRPPKKSF
jgi:very-short-patch-repair endonuclease